jgi:hypothetical protein
MNNIAFFFVVCDRDIPLLYLAAHCLNKNWQGPKNIVIVSDQCTAEYKPLISSILLDWTITYIDGCTTSLNEYYAQGWYRQQVYKLVAPTQTAYDWLIILDCKNLMVRKSNLSDFINDGQQLAVAAPYAEVAEWQDKYTSEMAAESKQLTGGVESELLIYTITPQIFKRDVLDEMNKLFNFDKIKKWQGTEFFIYWYYYNTYYNPRWILNHHAVVSDISERRWGKPALTPDTLFLNLHRKNLSTSAIPTVTELVIRGVIDQANVSTFFDLTNR